ncbi:hypothetical protein BH23ACT9_BH23ACT9_34630 [soil metagenome]
MRRPDHLTEILVTEGLDEHLARHGVTVDEVRQVLQNGFELHPNKREGAAGLVLVGRTDMGAAGSLCTPVGRTRPMTNCSMSEPPDPRREHDDDDK